MESITADKRIVGLSGSEDVVEDNRKRTARGRRLHLAVYAIREKYLRQGGNVGERLETFLTSSAAESIIRKLTPTDRAAFEDLVSACLGAAVQRVVTDARLAKAFARLTVDDFLRFERRYFKCTA
jgi:hypothetical protein